MFAAMTATSPKLIILLAPVCLSGIAMHGLLRAEMQLSDTKNEHHLNETCLWVSYVPNDSRDTGRHIHVNSNLHVRKLSVLLPSLCPTTLPISVLAAAHLLALKTGPLLTVVTCWHWSNRDPIRRFILRQGVAVLPRSWGCVPIPKRFEHDHFPSLRVLQGFVPGSTSSKLSQKVWRWKEWIAG